jgi:hypothetical protein
MVGLAALYWPPFIGRWPYGGTYFCNRVAYPSWQLEIVAAKGVVSIHRVANNKLTSGCPISTAAKPRK